MSLLQIENDSFIHLKHLQRLELHGCALTTVEPLAFRGVEATLQVHEANPLKWEAFLV